MPVVRYSGITTIFMCIFGAKSPKMGMLTLNIGEKMKNFLGAIALVLMSPLVFAGGQSMSDSQGNNMSSAKASSGVHFGAYVLLTSG